MCPRSGSVLFPALLPGARGHVCICSPDSHTLKKYVTRSPHGSFWEKFFSVDPRDSDIALFRIHERTGRPIGDDAFTEKLERLLDRELKPQKPGPKVKDQ